MPNKIFWLSLVQHNSQKETVFRDLSPSPKQVLRWIGRVIGILVALSVLIVLILRWVNPPITSYMAQNQIVAWWNHEKHFRLRHQWVGHADMNWTIKVAAITSEDQTFAENWGFDFKQIQKAIEGSGSLKSVRGASTITQQTARNLFLWPAHSFFRKGVEAYFTILLDLLWPKTRVLEVYLNIAQFGPDVYGVQAASRIYFHTTAAHLSKAQSALMVTALPDPDDYSLAHPSSYMLHRRNWVLFYMNKLGNQAYLSRFQ
jgi:monofunctional biosynthetic peptidoglycan transglycosylase